jgi:hypothetical protein
MKLIYKLLSLFAALSLNLSTLYAGQVIGTLPELSTQAKVGMYKFSPRYDQEWVDSSLNVNLDIKKFGCKIIAYRILWETGAWSNWYVPGLNDLYKSDNDLMKRYWAFFMDHTFQIVASSYGTPAFMGTSETVVNPKIVEFGSLPELSTQGKVAAKQFVQMDDGEMVSQSLDLNLDVKKFGCKIIAYRIQWWDGTWSEYFVPGVNDLYKNDDEIEYVPLRRRWALFVDHSFQIIYTGTLTAK